jgi:predicted phosphate transport protein (TIGR00153 family)
MKKIFTDRDKELEEEIETYLCSLSNAALLFYEGVKDYVQNDCERFDDRLKEVTEAEKEADAHLKKLKFSLYKYNLIPDFSGDVLELLDSMDNIGDMSKQVLLQLSIERPVICDFVKKGFTDMAKACLKSVEALLCGVRLFFTQIKMVDEHINKVYFYEKEADNLEEKLKRAIFNTQEDIHLSHKMQLRYFVHEIVELSDVAESVAQKLAVYKVKRTI